SWYLGQDGNPELWPWTPDRHRARLAQLDLTAYDLRGVTAAQPADRARSEERTTRP
ncbi:MAG: hypothetical protein QOG76_6489, partial [Pseudonocardiales bacterium]|nr:hypothetical protein [Pseudonocardiales bacterium]